ncbi:MAG: alcohol dehydrogenase catalytic domain-containing protein [Spirochaetales bacterium]|jgi:bacteriochlorophyllide a dehydrogenase|nr:alcohol dehydrogenase catalytic domain-containing protein [Spirochaetales bacterium]
MKAKAVIFTGPSAVEFGEVSCPDPGDHDVVVETSTSWISNGTEGSFLRGERIEGDVAYRNGDPWPFPIVAGYQKVGVVNHVGKSVTRLKVGDEVFATIGYVEGLFENYGGQLSLSVSNEEQVFKIPGEEETGIPADAYSGLVLTQVGYNCGARPPVEIGNIAVVFGDGMVGQWAAQTLWWRGAHVILLGRHDDRLARFVETGNLHAGRKTINTYRDSWEEELASALDGKSVDVFVDTVGSIDAINSFLPNMKRFSHVISAGFYGTEDLLALQALRNFEIGIDLVSGWQTGRLEETLELVSRNILETLPLVTHRFPATEAADAWKLIEEKADGVLGVLLDWEGIQ